MTCWGRMMDLLQESHLLLLLRLLALMMCN
jgi:hypothetical protein